MLLGFVAFTQQSLQDQGQNIPGGVRSAQPNEIPK
ncbi:hypothetical protein CY0110_02289 [Crocosphaera chwakensis CCY0110]|uniref:Uncharacterized protein n=1 Tax=Crocosphaera chwakensis CCY0110 TaxID=391612 RepID=A3IM61_9CHRO|nr:hypothetical protein CY0110_02289 [Crocosphaera chwakensis CCY0110]